MKLKIKIYFLGIISFLAMNMGKVNGSEIEQNICETLPRSILCQMKQSQERSRREFEQKEQEYEEARQKRQQEELNQYLLVIKQKYGYNPLLYTLKINLYGNTLTVFSNAGWIRMTVDSKKGDITAIYTVADRDCWTGFTHWHDKKTIKLTFTLDQKACEKFYLDKNCTFSGTDKVNLGSFVQEHELVKYGTWEISYLEDEKKKSVEFKIPLNKKPENSTEEFNPKEFRVTYCRRFPESVSCLYLKTTQTGATEL